MSANRLPYFPFDVAAYLNDPAVLGMSADTEGIYVRLLARMWQSATPGRVFPDLIHELASVSRLSEQYRVLYRRDDWDHPEVYGNMPLSCEEIGIEREKEVIEELREAFDTTSEPGVWIQKRMLIEWKRALQLTAARQKGAELTNKSRNHLRAERTPSERLAVANREVEVDLEGERKEEKKESKALRSRARKDPHPKPTEPAPESGPEGIVNGIPRGPSWAWDPGEDPRPPANPAVPDFCDPQTAHDAVAELEVEIAGYDAEERAQPFLVEPEPISEPGGMDPPANFSATEELPF